MNNGAPSTDLKALTGEFTPPGKYVFDFSNNPSETVRFNVFLAIISTNFQFCFTKILFLNFDLVMEFD
jgi:hypothetical protein